MKEQRQPPFPWPQVMGPKRLKSLEAAEARVVHHSDAISFGNSDALQPVKRLSETYSCNKKVL